MGRRVDGYMGGWVAVAWLGGWTKGLGHLSYLRFIDSHQEEGNMKGQEAAFPTL